MATTDSKTSDATADVEKTETDLGTITITYFESRGRAEQTRLVLAESGADWKDVRVTKEQFAQLKPNLPYGQVPILESSRYPGVVLAQSNSIARFVARHYGLYGKNAVEAAQIDGVLDAIVDIRQDVHAFVTGSWVAAENKAEGKEKLQKELLPKHFAYLEKMVQANKSGWLVGNSISLADITLFNIVHAGQTEFPDTLANFPGLRALYQHVSERPRIAAWLKSRPITPW